MKELFDKRFVYFLWEDKLIGKDCFTANSIKELITKVNECDVKCQVKKGDNDEFPFKADIFQYKFAYYDLNYDIKIAYNEGKQIQFQSLVDGSWCDCGELSEDSWYDNYKYRIKPEQSKLMTRRQLAEWLAKGNGEVTWGSNVRCYSTLDYDDSKRDSELQKDYKIRKWNSNEWIKPTVDIYEEDCGK